MAASWSGVTPSRLAADTFAPAAISRSARSRSSPRAAQCSAVVPSTCGALTSALSCTSARTPLRSPFAAASAIPLLPAACATPAERSAINPAMPATETNLMSASPASAGTASRIPAYEPSSIRRLLYVLENRRRRRIVLEAELLRLVVRHQLRRQRRLAFAALRIEVKFEQRELVVGRRPGGIERPGRGVR